MSTQIRNRKNVFSLIKKALNMSARFLFQKILKPKSKSRDEKRKELTLNIFLFSIVVLFGSGLIVAIYRFFFEQNYDGLNPVIFSGMFLFFLILYIYSRLKYSKVISYIFIWIFFLFISYEGYIKGIDIPAVLLFYTLLIVISGILINTRYAFVMGLAILIAIFSMGYLQVNNLIEFDSSWKLEKFEMIDIFFYMIIFAIVGIVSWLSNREIERSLKRALISENKLKKERDLLDFKVKQKVRELKEIQMEQVSQIFRFAEFGKISSGLFHDLMNYLTGVSLNIEMIKEDEKRSISEVKSYLNKAVGITRYMEEFIIAIKKQINQESSETMFSLSEEIFQMISLVSYKARKMNVEIVFNPAKEIKTFGDLIEFNQVITNLLNNAIDSYDNLEKKDKKIVIDLDEKDDVIYLSVEDWGIGIPKKNIDKIFEPFFSTKKDKKGYGIGLSLVKRIIENDFKGSVNVISEVNKGTKFIIKFPKRDKKQNEKTNNYLSKQKW